MSKKILILTGGPLSKIVGFYKPSEGLRADVTLCSFYDLNFASSKNQKEKTVLKVGNQDIREFGLIYIRLVGRRMEEASLVINFAKENGIKVVDSVYLNSLFIPSTISKAMEMKKLIDAGIPLPYTIFAKLTDLGDRSPKEIGYPFVVKSTSGRKARDAWLIDSKDKWETLFPDLRKREKEGVHFFAQKPVIATQRIRALVVGDEVVGVITRPTKWRVALAGVKKEDGEKRALVNPDQKYVDLALKSSRAVGLDIAGIDILEDDKTGELFVIEANAAPAWKLIANDCGVNVEEKVLSFLNFKLRVGPWAQKV